MQQVKEPKVQQREEKEMKWKNQEFGKKGISGQENSPRRREAESKHLPSQQYLQNQRGLSHSASIQGPCKRLGIQWWRKQEWLLFILAETAINWLGLCWAQWERALWQGTGQDNLQGQRDRAVQQINYKGKHSFKAFNKYYRGPCVLGPGDTAVHGLSYQMY